VAPPTHSMEIEVTKSEKLKERIENIRTSKKGVAEKMHFTERAKWDDNLTVLERRVLRYLANRSKGVDVKTIAVAFFGEDVPVEAYGMDSVRSIRNALRVPKSMGLIEPIGKGLYVASDKFKSRGFEFAREVAALSRAKSRTNKKERKRRKK